MNALARLSAIVLFSIYPLLFVYFRNEAFIFDADLKWPVLIVSVVSMLLYTLLNFLNNKKTNNVIIVIVLMGWFLFYGHIYYSLLNFFDLKYASIRHRFFLPLYSIFFFIPVWFLWKANTVSDKIINTFFIIALILNLQFLFHNFHSLSASNSDQRIDKISMAQPALPDVYYIILDAYTNNENMKKYYQYDNSEFLNPLRDLGFSIIDSARSNYPFTYFSLPSSLNMEYINYFEDSISQNKNENLPFEKIDHSKVVHYFKSKGYKYVLYQSAFGALNDKSEADIFIECSMAVNEYYQSIIQLSILNTINLDFYGQGVFDLCKKTLALLPKTPQLKGNKFVFFHSLPPHPPFIFDEKGNHVSYSQNIENRFKQIEGYVKQVKFLDTEILETVKSLLKNSENPPIVIIQGDHGTCSSARFEDYDKWELNPSKELVQERFGILNAIYLPEKYKIDFPKNHTPVNTFRLIFNKLFNDTLQILPCKSYFARYRKNYMFREVNWAAVNGVVKDSILVYDKF